jgi:hypothetical protein
VSTKHLFVARKYLFLRWKRYFVSTKYLFVARKYLFLRWK